MLEVNCNQLMTTDFRAVTRAYKHCARVFRTCFNYMTFRLQDSTTSNTLRNNSQRIIQRLYVHALSFLKVLSGNLDAKCTFYNTFIIYFNITPNSVFE